MKVHLVTFSDKNMDRSARLCMSSATKNGVDYTGYWPHDKPSSHSRRAGIGLRQTSFYKHNEALLSQPRGLGFWAWKPYIIEKSMRSCGDGDIFIYADAGIEFIAPVSRIIDRMDQDIFLFGNNWEHAHWCKRDVVETVWPDYRMGTVKTEDDYRYRSEQMWSRFGRQCQASVIFFRVSDYSRRFVTEWLKWCLFEGGRLIDDSPSRAPNHPEFREHRHDQAILTTMAYRNGLTLHYWPASYNDGAFVYEKLPEYASDSYPILFNHHRRRNHEWKEIA
jgi:hypothetical protein